MTKKFAIRRTELGPPSLEGEVKNPYGGHDHRDYDDELEHVSPMCAGVTTVARPRPRPGRIQRMRAPRECGRWRSSWIKRPWRARPKRWIVINTATAAQAIETIGEPGQRRGLGLSGETTETWAGHPVRRARPDQI